MKNLVCLVTLMLAILGIATITGAQCVTIQDGTLMASREGVPNAMPITTGYDEYGYNYQAHMFNGIYSDYDRWHGGPYSGVTLQMKWNDAWLSNKDCNGDGKLDRHFGFPTYKGSGAWLTNHQSDETTWINVAGKQITSTWTYFVKIVAVPSDATLTNGYWYSSDGTLIGPAIWGDFAIVQEVYNDPLEGVHGKLFISPYSPGFGVYAP